MEMVDEINVWLRNNLQDVTYNVTVQYNCHGSGHLHGVLVHIVFAHLRQISDLPIIHVLFVYNSAYPKGEIGMSWGLC